MCHHANVYAVLSADDKKAAKKLTGMLIPVYASIVLAVIAIAAIGGGAPQHEQVALRAAPAAAR
jgi:hypothetical protein